MNVLTVIFMWFPHGRPRHFVLHRREAHRERIDRDLCGLRTEGPGIASYLGNKHTVDVFTVQVWGAQDGRYRQCVLHRREAHIERI